VKAVYLDSVQTLSQRELDTPVAGKNQVLVKMEAVGVCGSDVHYWHKGRIGQFIVREPMILGHECAGSVVAVGADVTHLAVGDRVVLEPGVPCWTCDHCKTGMYNLCPDIRFFATPPVDGSLVEYVAYDANLTFKIPEEIQDYGLATMVEPLAVGVFATRKVQPKLGDAAVVFGAGVIGIACMLAAKAAGCMSVTVADIREDRLKTIQALGADHIVDLKTQSLPDACFNIGYEATGADACYAHAAKCMKPGGRVSLVGMGADTSNAPIVDFVCREIALIPSFRYANSYGQALQLLCLHRDALAKVITHRFPFLLEGVEQAMRTAHADPAAGKVIIDF